jgi:putative peptide zinc metalloprotease protein
VHTVRSHIVREFPRAVSDLPSAAFSTAGGGQIPADPSDRSGKKTLDEVFLFDLALEPVSPSDQVGSHVYVRFQHRSEPLAEQAYERARQLLLSRLSV